MYTFFIICLVILVLLIFWGIGIYNHLVRLRNQVKNGWSQIDVQLQRRYDLIPNLIEAVKGYMGHERQTLKAVVDARNQANEARVSVGSEGPNHELLSQIAGAEAALKSSIPRIFALAENYPDLKANQNMQHLQEELTSTENKVAFSRQAYNDIVLSYNNEQEVFPAAILAKRFGHHPAELFEIAEEEVKRTVKVDFSN